MRDDERRRELLALRAQIDYMLAESKAAEADTRLRLFLVSLFVWWQDNHKAVGIGLVVSTIALTCGIFAEACTGR